ncbi:MAG: enoyl-ACP reductase [Halanaerobiales bacterium]
MAGLMEGKTGLIMGVANSRSIAYKIAERLHKEGAELAFSYQDERIAEKAVPLFKELDSIYHDKLNVLDDDNFAEFFNKLSDKLDGKLDFLVHSIAGGPGKEDLKGMFIDTSREGFLRSMEISVYSFIKALHLAYPMMEGRNAAALTLSYYGAEKVIPNYNVMGVAKSALESSVRYMADDLGQEGIRVNALSPGPVLTRAASAVSGFRKLLQGFEDRAPMKRLIEREEIASSALYLLSNLSSGVTGEVVHVDAGYNIKG